ncbi:MAG: 50S ribosomal protein L11 methyltransferase [Bacteroidota bacterium]
MSYIEVSCRVFPAEPASDILIAQMAEIGFEGFTDSDTGVLAYIPKEHFDADALQELGIVKSGAFDISFDYAEIEEENWNAVWESNYDPVDIDGECLVRAPFHEKQEGFDYEIVLEPKMAFGTAHHETTFLSIQQMLKMDFKDKKVLDMGSGTGILSILASKLGAKSIIAIDNDPWAYKNALENFKMNDVDNAEAVEGDALSVPDNQFDIVLANINRNIVIQDMKHYAKALKKSGTLLLSGFYEHEAEMVGNEAQKYHIRITSQSSKNDWVALLAQKH